LEELSSKFGILAEISEKLPKNKKPVLVGGSAVEFYTRGTCKSIDIDLLADLPQANISQHLTVLRQNGVVETRREGANIYYKIANPKILQACDLMREVLLEKLSESKKLAKRML
jgi:DNA-binding transcriptional ArsR family regulator